MNRLLTKCLVLATAPITVAASLVAATSAAPASAQASVHAQPTTQQSGATATTLVPDDATWSWRYAPGAPPPDWADRGFDDSSWAAGPAALGFGDASIATGIDTYASTSARPLAAYFRHSFDVEDASAVASMTVTTVADDGVVVSVNGTEVGRSNMPSGPISYRSYASSGIGTASAVPVTFTVPSALLVDGSNVIAAETHLNYHATRNVSFHLSASAELGSAPPPPPPGVDWTKVGSGITGGISGLTPAPSGWVIARDNKSAGQNRIALLSTQDQITDLAWPGTEPSDLESIDVLPDHPNRYVTCTSAGRCYELFFGGGNRSFTITNTFTLPVGGNQNEAFAMTTADNGWILTVWADRGTASTPATLYAATFNFWKGTFGHVASARVTVPWPTTNVRPISDATVVGNRIVITSAADNGDNGPFDSAVYDVGTVGRHGGWATLDTHTPASLGRFSGHKVEGIACSDAATPGLLGTDDENLGGYLTRANVCAPPA